MSGAADGSSTNKGREALALAAVGVLVVARHRAAALVDDLARQRAHARDVPPVLLGVSHVVLVGAQLMTTRATLLRHLLLFPVLSENLTLFKMDQVNRRENVSHPSALNDGHQRMNAVLQLSMLPVHRCVVAMKSITPWQI